MKLQPIYIKSYSSVSPVSHPDLEGDMDMPVVTDGRLKAIEPEYKNYIPDAGLRRRMSRIVKMGVAAAMDCLNRVSPDEVGAILTATGLGCLTDTEKFLKSLIESEERLLNPTPFIQSTFNTIGGQVALICKNHHYNVTYAHRGLSFESACLDAAMVLAEGEAGNVLVGGTDELTETQFKVMERLGWWRGNTAGEGAQFFAFCKSPDNCSIQLEGMEFGSLDKSVFDADACLARFLDRHQVSPGDVDLVLSGEPTGDFRIEGCRGFDYKQFCGEYATASSFGLWLACVLLDCQVVVDRIIPDTEPCNRILVYTRFRDESYSFYLLKKSELCGGH